MSKRIKRKNNKIKNIILIVVSLILLFISVIIVNGYNMYRDAIQNISLEDKIIEIKNDSNYINLNQVSKYYLDATIAVEDHRFYKHIGFDVISTTRALFSNILDGSLVARGGSTITQQLAKNMYFSQDKIFSRKIAELFVVYQLEKKLSKDEILELYVNIIYFGDGYYGIKEASYGYFKKDADDLSLEEAIMLAGLPAAPSVYSPTVNSKLANERYKQVEASMIKYGYSIDS